MPKTQYRFYVFIFFFLLCFIFQPHDILAQKLTQIRTFGVSPQACLPVGNLGNWYPITPGIGVTGQFFLSAALHIELQYVYAHFPDGSVASNSFFWPVDKQYYTSPQAKAEMNLHSISVNFLFRGVEKHIFNRQWVPFIMLGSGFYAFNNSVSGLIYPGQGTRPLNKSLLLPATEDQQVALGANLGVGFEHPLLSRVDLDFRIRYQLVLGNIRSFEDWGITETFPLQMVNFELGVRYKL
jgi:hypothetical protein